MSFHIIRNDIAKVKADAIVNTANPEATYGCGVDSAIYNAAGIERLLKERKKIGPIARGDAAVTPAFKLKAKYIIHTVGPYWIDGAHGEEDTLTSCYKKSLEMAEELGCKSIAFPLISTGVYGFPKDKGLQIALNVLQSYAMHSAMEICLVIYDTEAYEITSQVFKDIENYIEANYIPAYDERGLRSELRVQNRKRPWYDDWLKASIPYRPSEPLRDEAEILPEREEIEEQAFGFVTLESDHMSESPRLERVTSEDGDLPRSAAGPKSSAVPKANAAIKSKGADKPPQFGKLPDFPGAVEDTKTFQEKFFEYLDKTGLTDPEFYKKLNLSKQMFSKVRSNPQYQPTKNTAVIFCLGLELDLEQATDLMARAGYAFSPSNKLDLFVKSCFVYRMYDFAQIDLYLAKQGYPMLLKYE